MSTQENNYCILVVATRDLWLRRSLEILSAQEMFEITVQESIPVAVALLQNRDFHAIVVDSQLPGFADRGAMDRLRGPDLALPIVVISDAENAATAVESISLGASDYVIRNVDGVDALSRAIRFAMVVDRMQTQLSLQNEVLQAAIGNSSDGVMVVDREGIVRYCNPAAESMTGQSSVDVVGKRVRFPIGEGLLQQSSGADGETAGRPVEMHPLDTSWHGKPAHLIWLREISPSADDRSPETSSTTMSSLG